MVRKTSKTNNVSIPGIFRHLTMAFGIIFGHLRLFLPLFLVGTMICAVTINLTDVASAVFGTIVWLILWLTTICILRHLMAGKKIKFRDALYNSMTTMVPTVLVGGAMMLQLLPAFFLVVLFATATETNLFSTTAFGVISLLIAIVVFFATIYCLVTTLVALVAVSAPGLYPVAALKMAHKVVRGHRGDLVVRLLVLELVLGLIDAVLVLPMVPFYQTTSMAMMIVSEALSCFTTIMLATYVYLYYKWLIGEPNNDKS